MKYVKYLTVGILTLPLVSFTVIEKPKGFIGHVQWIQSTSYHALMDSSGNITKGAVISDTDIDDRMQRYGGPLRHSTYAEPPIEAWTYDESGNQLEHDKYHANGKLYNKIM